MKNNGVKFGLISGLFTILIYLASYFFLDIRSLISITSWENVVGLIIGMVLMYMAAKKTRDQKGGYIPFGEALVPAFITSAISTFIGIFFFYILVNFIDPSLQDVMAEATLDSSRKMFEMAGMSEDKILEELEKVEDQESNSLASIAIGFFTSILIMGLPLSAIIAAIVMKKEPMIQP